MEKVLKRVSSLLAVMLCIIGINFSSAFAQQQPVVLSNVTLIDGHGGEKQENMTVVIQNYIIAGIFPTRDYIPQSNADVLDLTGRYLIPGLIDSHVHVFTSNLVEEEGKSSFEEAKNSLRRGIYGGLTTVRDLGGNTVFLSQLNKLTITGEIPGPEIYFSAIMAGPSFLVEDERPQASRGSYQPGTTPWIRAVTHDSNIEEIILSARDFGVTAIKMYTELDKEIVSRLTGEAHYYGLKVWSHIEISPATAEDAIFAGVDVITHADMFAKYLEDGTLDDLLLEMKKRGTIFDPTLLVMQLMAEMPEDEIPEGMEEELNDIQNILKSSYEIVRRANELGVTIVAGTDEPISHDDDQLPGLHTELELLVENCGFTPMEALVAATKNGALAVGMEKHIGTVDVGKIADLVVLRDDPTENISNTRSIEMVFKQGKKYAQ